MTDTALRKAPADVPDLDATLTILRRSEKSIATMAAYLHEARDRLAAASDDLEARRAVRMAELRMRADAFALAQDFTALAQPEL